MFGNQTVYLWLLNTSGMTGFIAWLGIAISHYRFRRGYVMQGHDLTTCRIAQVPRWANFRLHSVSDYYAGPEL
jgi:amino acid permease